MYIPKASLVRSLYIINPLLTSKLPRTRIVFQKKSSKHGVIFLVVVVVVIRFLHWRANRDERGHFLSGFYAYCIDTKEDQSNDLQFARSLYEEDMRSHRATSSSISSSTIICVDEEEHPDEDLKLAHLLQLEEEMQQKKVSENHLEADRIFAFQLQEDESSAAASLPPSSSSSSSSLPSPPSSSSSSYVSIETIRVSEGRKLAQQLQ